MSAGTSALGENLVDDYYDDADGRTRYFGWERESLKLREDMMLSLQNLMHSLVTQSGRLVVLVRIK